MSTTPAPHTVGRRSTLRQKGWSPTVGSQRSQPRSHRSPLNLQKPLPPRPDSFSSSVYSDDTSTCFSTAECHSELNFRQNPNRYGMDVSKFLPPAHNECCCGKGEDGTERHQTSTATDHEPKERLPIYSAYSSSGSGPLTLPSSPRSPRKSYTYGHSSVEQPPELQQLSEYNHAIPVQSSEVEDVKTGEEPQSSTRTPQGLGIQEIPVTPRTNVTFAASRPHTYSGRSQLPRRAPAPPPLKLYERALAESYVKTPYPSSARVMSGVSQKSVFEEEDDDEDDDEDSGGGRWNPKDSIHSSWFRGDTDSSRLQKPKHLSGLGDFTQPFRRSAARMGMREEDDGGLHGAVVDVKTPHSAPPVMSGSQIRPEFAHRPPPPIPSPPLMTTQHRRNVSAPTATTTTTTTTTTTPPPGRMKSILLKAKRSFSLGLSEDGKKDKKDRAALRGMVQSGATDAKLGQKKAA